MIGKESAPSVPSNSAKVHNPDATPQVICGDQDARNIARNKLPQTRFCPGSAAARNPASSVVPTLNIPPTVIPSCDPSQDHIIKHGEYTICVRDSPEKNSCLVHVYDKDMQSLRSRNPPVQLSLVTWVELLLACGATRSMANFIPHPADTGDDDVAPDACRGTKPIPVVGSSLLYDATLFTVNDDAIETFSRKRLLAEERNRLRYLQKRRMREAPDTSGLPTLPYRRLPSESGKYVGGVLYNPEKDRVLKHSEYTIFIKMIVFSKDMRVVGAVIPLVRMYNMALPDEPMRPLAGTCNWPVPRHALYRDANNRAKQTTAESRRKQHAHKRQHKGKHSLQEKQNNEKNKKITARHSRH
ncbi:hypothetical protein FISHEDRAFT_58711 [Fistulina hepatica ATCC 64428]|uniref:Uncharacterized protein n=1 Tax=Fistulina hepatica ATCC 64428 TaxID=1128425 RepID=A0A0D7AD21_9AGAR|nr:hypothetical protein FISHEDRAFT_58711 [Fistulina hepatica ATCC 64428]